MIDCHWFQFAVNQMRAAMEMPIGDDPVKAVEDLANKFLLNQSALCGAKISAKVKQFSERRYGQSLCLDCQKAAQASA